MNRKSIVVIFTLLLTFGKSFFAIKLYVATFGYNNNTGAVKKPFSSVAKAVFYVLTSCKKQKLTELAEIFVAFGIYNLQSTLIFTPEDSGTDVSALIIKGMDESKPIFSWGGTLKVFEKISDSLWKIQIREITSYGGQIKQLFVNEKRAIRAGIPNGGDCFKDNNVSESSLETNRGNSLKLRVQKLRLIADQIKKLPIENKQLQNVVVSINHAWDRTRKYIIGVSLPDSALFIPVRPIAKWDMLNNTSQFYFENAFKFLETPGEWFLSPIGALYYIPRTGEKIESTSAIVPNFDVLVRIVVDNNHYEENIRFEKISFQYTHCIKPSSGNEPTQAAALTDAVIMDFARIINFYNCDISDNASNGKWFSSACENSEITNSYLHDLDVGGIKIDEISAISTNEPIINNIIVDNNIIRSGGYEFPTGVGIIVFRVSDNAISHNEIANFKYSGISLGWVWGFAPSQTKRNKVIFNYLKHLRSGILSDTGSVYTLGASENTLISGNVINDIYSFEYGGWGLYADQGSTGVMFKNNLVYNCKSSAFHPHYGKDNIVRNNIIFTQIKAELDATRTEKHLSFSFKRNILCYSTDKLLVEADGATINIAADSEIYWSDSQEMLFNLLTI